ncbi:Fc fragment of IgE receptor Ig [Nothobranchius furzeri]|uniref:Fc of IgE receptor Ig n=1 Tax=Nothobranchius furzeri TaxID=105023 RepID=A0A9D3BGS4_NOTFU|nr:Fc fragment of IgE receptor Ig [Nothobranchius furzeri]
MQYLSPHQSAEGNKTSSRFCRRELKKTSRPSLTRVYMAVWGRAPLLAAVPLWMCFGRAAALSEPEICYVLDGILFLYGIILTALYCRVKIYNAREASGVKGKPKEVNPLN